MATRWHRSMRRSSCGLYVLQSYRSKTTFATRKSLTARPSPDVLRFATFNVLAPCHKRLVHGRRESAFDTICLERQRQIARLTMKYAPTVFCLQEYWFDSTVRELYQHEFRDLYRTLALKRPGHRQDGLLLAYNPKHVTMHAHSNVIHKEAGRVSLLAHLTAKLPQAPAVDLIVANTHLNFPHSEADEPVRQLQTQQLMEAIADFQQQQQVDNVMLLGDFNGRLDSQPCQFVQQQGYASGYGLVHTQEPHVTHRNHLGEQVSVDFIFTNKLPGFTPWAATVLPEHASDEAWPQGFTLSDHRPVVVDFKAV
eukprot:m.32747 g.32747  ORF g.32747 m.32747 type:complete len:310 (+) comp12183_c0_seq1:33-962(+)